LSWGHRLKIVPKRKYIEITDDSKIISQKNIDRYGPRLLPNVCKRPDLRVMN
jgi:hypothetical protein